MAAKGNNRADLKWMRELQPVDSWKDFETVLKEAQEMLEPIVKRTGRREYINAMTECAFNLVGTLSNESKRRFRIGINTRHREFLIEWDKGLRTQFANPDGKRVYAFKECCKLLKKWIWDENIFQTKGKPATE